jgi:hypothetical protein
MRFLQTICRHLSVILEWMADDLTTYTSYLVRMWQQSRSDNPRAAVWHAEVEHIQTGQRRRFLDPNDLWSFLNPHNQTGEQDAPPTYKT